MSRVCERLLDFAKQVAWSLPIGIAFTDLVGTVVRVEGPSMQPTFNPGLDADRPSSSRAVSQDWILVEKISYKLLHDYRRGDVATLWAPDNPRIQMTKRLAALQGDTIWDDSDGQPLTIPQGRCWVEGDNASHSADSRNMYGPVHLGLLEGRAMAVVWPPSRMGPVARVPVKGRVIAEAEEVESLVRPG